MNYVVTRIQMHQAMHVIGLGQLSNTLPDAGKSIKLTMRTDAHGVLVRAQLLVAPGGGPKSQECCFLVPWANIIHASVIDPDKVAKEGLPAKTA